MKLSLMRQVEALYKFADTPVKRVGLGIAGIDDLIVGPAPGEVCMIIGRSFSGKSVLGQNIIRNNPGLASIFFSMEMPYLQAVIRLYSMLKNTSSKEVQTLVELGNPPEDIWDLCSEFPKHVIVDQPSLTLEDMSRTLEEYRKSFSYRPDFVVIDYLELLAGAKASAEGYLATEAQATMLKDWAKREEMRVFVLHQANKQEPRWLPPTDSSARNGGYTEADFVLGMWRPHTDPKLQYVESLALRETVCFNILKDRVFFSEAHKIDTYISESLRLVDHYAYENKKETG